MDIRGFREKISEFLIHLEVEKNVSAHTLRAYSSDLRQILEFWEQAVMHDKTLQDDLGRVTTRYVQSLFFKKLAKASLARKLSCLRSIGLYLQRQDISIPMQFKMPRIERKLPVILTVDEIFYLLDGVKLEDLPTQFPWRDKAVFELLYATGVRCSELVNIRLQDFDFPGKSVRVVGKGRKTRVVLFGQKAYESLDRYMQEERPCLLKDDRNDILFLNYAGGQLTTRSVQRICEMFRKFLKIERNLTPHKIRHSFATHMLNQGVDLRVVQELLGHKMLATTEIYTHVSSAELAKMCDEKHPLNSLQDLVLDK